MTKITSLILLISLSFSAISGTHNAPQNAQPRTHILQCDKSEDPAIRKAKEAEEHEAYLKDLRERTADRKRNEAIWAFVTDINTLCGVLTVGLLAGLGFNQFLNR